MRSNIPPAIRSSLLDPSNFVLSSNGAGGSTSPSPTRNISSPPGTGIMGNLTGAHTGRYVVNDPRWKFVSEDKFPKPRDFVGGPKKYRAGRGSSVPLDLNAL